MLLPSLGPSLFKMDCSVLTTLLWSDNLKFEISFGNDAHHILWAKEEKDYLASY